MKYTNCIFCGKELTREQRKRNKFCSLDCSTRYKKESLLNNWLKTGKLNYKCNTMIKVNSVYRHYIENEQNNKCAICGISNNWNNKSLIFILDHIDGDSSNHSRSNLRLICPNCDSQLETYKSKNKKSSRNYRTSQK